MQWCHSTGDAIVSGVVAAWSPHIDSTSHAIASHVMASTI